MRPGIGASQKLVDVDADRRDPQGCYWLFLQATQSLLEICSFAVAPLPFLVAHRSIRDDVQRSFGFDRLLSKPDDEPAKCPIKKTIDGKTYCFQNDPALTKPQRGD